MYNQRPMFVNILLFIGFLFIAGTLLSVVMGLVGGLLWFGIKILIPVAIIVWLIRVISGTNGRGRNSRPY